MNPTGLLHLAGQSLWLDNITRDLLSSGTLGGYARELSITGLTSNPTIYDRAISGTSAYDESIRASAARGTSAEETFYELALDDLREAADIFRPAFDRTCGVDGYVSLEVSPVLAHDGKATTREATRLHTLGGRPNLLIKIPGTTEGLQAVEDSIFAGVPVNVTLLFSASHYLANAEAYTRGIERRVQAGMPPQIGSVASMFISRWDAAVTGSVPENLRNRLGIAIGQRAYAEYHRFFSSDRWRRLLNVGARPQRLLFASTGTKDPATSDVLYVEGLAAPYTVNTMPEETLLAFADHGTVGDLLISDPAPADRLLARYATAGVDVDAVGDDLQAKGAESFMKSWSSLVARIDAKVQQVANAG